MKIPLAEQIEEMEIEWESRSKEYPELIVRGKLRRERAEVKIARVQAVIGTLCWLREHAELLRGYIAYAKKHGMSAEQVADEYDKVEASIEAEIKDETADLRGVELEERASADCG